MSSAVRILFLADSHLGLDLPVRPRVKRRRRGDDFLANYAAALAPARAGEVDLVVHGGDVFDRSHVPASLAYQALEPLRRIADAGIPVFVVPGNHERSLLPHARLAAHPRVHVFDRPRTFVLEVRGTRLALAGFPYERGGVRALFPRLLEETGWKRVEADAWLLCIHQCVEGARVGPADFTFRDGEDVVRGRDIPAGFAAVLSGHIHRHQVLTVDLSHRPLAAPVLYPGSIERTALAEIGETKGFMIVRVPAAPRAAPGGPPAAAGALPTGADRGGPAGDAGALATGADRGGPAGDAGAGGRGRLRGDGGWEASWEFRPLPARPMIVQQLTHDGMGPEGLERALRATVAAAPADAVLTVRIAGDLGEAELPVLSAARLRSFVPESMNVEIQLAGRGGWARRREEPANGHGSEDRGRATRSNALASRAGSGVKGQKRGRGAPSDAALALPL